MTAWVVYILHCADDTLYTGITKDVARRVREHNADDALGARYTRSRRPVRLVYAENCETRSEATRREAAIRKLGRRGKQALLAGYSPCMDNPN